MEVSATSSVKMTSGAPCSLTTTLTGLPSAIGRASALSLPKSVRRLTMAGSMRSWPDSALATSSRSFTKASRTLPEFLISSTW